MMEIVDVLVQEARVDQPVNGIEVNRPPERADEEVCDAAQREDLIVRE